MSSRASERRRSSNIQPLNLKSRTAREPPQIRGIRQELETASAVSSASSAEQTVLGVVGSQKFIRQARKALSYQPSYRLSPVTKPSLNRIYRVMEQATARQLKGFKYNGEKSREMSLSLSDEIKDRLKYLDGIKNSRFRIVVSTTIGTKDGQALKISSRCCWSEDIDTHVTYHYQNNEYFCTSTVYLVYKE